MKGVSEIVSTIIILLIVITSASAFFYWYQTLEGQAMGTSSEFTTNMQKQIISTTTSLIDTYYRADDQANINNYGGTTETICAGDRELDLSNSKIGFIMWEGWGSNKELICSSYSLPCDCVGTETDTLGAILVKSGGIGLVSTTDGSTWEVQKDSAVPISVSNPTLINVNSLEFIEGGDSCKNPPNIFITGSICNGDGTCGNLNIIWNGGDQASTYEEEIGYAAGQETYWYDSTTMTVNLATNWPSSLAVPRLITDPQPTFLGGAAVMSNGTYVRALLAAKYSVYDVHTPLEKFGNTGSPVNTSGVTAVEKIVRMGVNQLLVGVSKDPISGGGNSYIDETTNTLDGTEKYYAGDMATCPYNMMQFQALGYIAHHPPNENKILNCDLTSGKVGPMLYEDDFVPISGGSVSELENKKPVYVAVSEISTGGTRSRVLYTGRDMNFTVFNILDDGGRLSNLEISDMIYSEADNSLVVAANNLSTSKAFLFYFNNTGVPSFLSMLDIGHVTSLPIVITSLEYFDDRVWFGGYRVGSPNVAVIYSVTDATLITQPYNNTSFHEISNLEKLTRCSEKAIHCSQGCDKTLAPRQCGDITLVFENTACDISSYSTGTQFSYTLNIGEHFTRSSIFEKKTAATNELSVTAL